MKGAWQMFPNAPLHVLIRLQKICTLPSHCFHVRPKGAFMKLMLCFNVYSITQYMAFGVSGSDSFTLMDGADVTIAWVDASSGPMAEDYHLRSGSRVQVCV